LPPDPFAFTDMSNNADNLRFTTISVGQPSPFPRPPLGDLAVGIILSYGVPIAAIHLPDVTDDDIVSLNGDPVGIALYQSDEIPAGVLVLPLRCEDDKVWTISAPLVDEPDELRRWAEKTIHGNTLLLTLIDSNTGMVCAQRTIGLPPRLLELAQAGIRRSPDIAPHKTLQALAELDQIDMWHSGTQWKEVDDGEEFTMTRTQY
jgi:hypothetical protein